MAEIGFYNPTKVGQGLNFFRMGCKLKIAKTILSSHEGQLPMIPIGESGNGEKHGKRKHYLPGMSPPFRKQLKFLIFVLLLVLPFTKNSAKPFAAYDQNAYVLSAGVPVFAGAVQPFFFD